MPLGGWAGPDGDLGRYISKQTQRSLDAYRAQPNLVDEHVNEERDTAHGGYRHRQLFELVQNSADAVWIDDGARGAGLAGGGRGRIEVRLTAKHLYCADDGEPIDNHGAKALMFSRLSAKRGTSQIGTFGLGFKAVLGVSESPEFFSRSGSFRFDRVRSQQQVRTVVSNAARCPVLRLPEPIDPVGCWEPDGVLRDLMAWAVNIVRLPLRRGARDDLRQQMEGFPAEFLLFVAHVGSFTLIDDSGAVDRVLELERVDDSYLLAEGDTTSEWRLFQRTHRLSGEARADRRPGDDRHEVPVWWAVPVDRLNRPGNFWAFFPTDTQSLVPGILNAPWKTNEDRQNLLTGRYNDELIAASATLIADALLQIPTVDDPARHLDVLPRRREAGDSHHANLLRERLFDALQERSVVPDQSGRLRRVEYISYPPTELTPSQGLDMAPFERWAAYPGRPDGWLHHKALLTRNRRATVDRLRAPGQPAWRRSRLPRDSVATWLEALVQNAAPSDAVAASMAAIQTAALIPLNIRRGADLGKIVLTESGRLRKPDPLAVFLPFDSSVRVSTADPDSTVNSELVADGETLSALGQLGLKPPSPEARFRAIAKNLMVTSSDQPTDAELLEEFWKGSRELEPVNAIEIIRDHDRWQGTLRVRTLADLWKPLHAVLIPGTIVPAGGSRDGSVTVDCTFHEPDQVLLSALGVAEGPLVEYDPRREEVFGQYERRQEKEYRRRDDLPGKPYAGYLEFTRYEKVGPLGVLRDLSEEAAASYTYALLGLDACYEPWVMWHTGTNRETYPKMYCEPLPIWFLRGSGRVQTPAGVVPLADALGPHPASPAALHALLQHPNAAKIKKALALSDPVPDLFGEGDPTPLIDVWPGLSEYLPAHRRKAHLVPCERILVAGAERSCVLHAPDVYLVGGVEDDERRALELIAEALDLRLRHH